MLESTRRTTSTTRWMMRLPGYHVPGGEVGDDYIGAVARKAGRGGTAEAGRAAGHQCDHLGGREDGGEAHGGLRILASELIYF